MQVEPQRAGLAMEMEEVMVMERVMARVEAATVLERVVATVEEVVETQ